MRCTACSSCARTSHTRCLPHLQFNQQNHLPRAPFDAELYYVYPCCVAEYERSHLHISSGIRESGRFFKRPLN